MKFQTFFYVVIVINNMGGGLLQLIAQGAQDVNLTGQPQISFFKANTSDTRISLLNGSHKP